MVSSLWLDIRCLGGKDFKDKVKIITCHVLAIYLYSDYAKSCTTQIILYPLQVPGNSYHIYMVIYTYSMYMNMRSGSHALLHVGKNGKMGFWEFYKYFMWESKKIWRIKYQLTQIYRTLNANPIDMIQSSVYLGQLVLNSSYFFWPSHEVFVKLSKPHFFHFFLHGAEHEIQISYSCQRCI